MRRTAYVKFKNSIISMVMLAALLALVWLLLNDKAFQSAIGSVVQILLWILIPVLTIIILTRWWQVFRPPIIYPFQNSTGDKDAQEHFDAMASNITVLLQFQLQQIAELLYIPQSGAVHHLAYNKNSVPRPAAPNKNDFAQTDLRVETELMQNLRGVGALSLGPVKLPLGGMLSILARVLRGPGITGSLQKYGSRLSVIAAYERVKWEVRSDSLPDRLQSEEKIYRELACCLAYKMLADIQGQSHWLALREILEGLEQYRRFIRSGHQNLHALQDAQRHFEQATVIDTQSAPAWYNLGVAYEAQGNDNAALESFKLASQFEPGLVEAHFGIGRNHARNGELDLAIQAGKRAITLAENAHKSVPAMRTSLGIWLTLAAQESELKEAERLCKDAIRNLSAADREYRWFAFKARFSEVASNEERRNLRDSHEQSLIELTQAHLLLDQIFSSVDQMSAEQEEQPRTFREALVRWYWCPRKKMVHTLGKRLRLNPNNGMTHAELGGLYARQGGYKKADIHLKQAGTISPEDIDVSFTISKYFLETAVADVKDLIAKSQQDTESWKNEWDSSRKDAARKQLSWASNYYDKVIRKTIRVETNEDLSSNIIQALNGMATVNGSAGILMALLDHDQGYREHINYAKQLLGKALALSPTDGEILSSLAGIYDIEDGLHNRLNATQEAESDDIKSDAVRLRETYDEIGEVFWSGSEWVLPALDQVDSSVENQVKLWVGGWLLTRSENPELGIDYLERALAMGEFHETAFVDYELGRVYQDLERWNDAIRCYTNVKREDPYYWQSQIKLADVLMEQNEASVINTPQLSSVPAQVRDKMVESGSQDTRSAAVLIADTNHEQVDEDQNAATRSEAESQSAREEPINANQAYEKAILAAQDDPALRAVALASRAELHRIQKKYGKSIKDCLEAMNLSPGYLYPYFVLASVYRDLCDYDRAIEYLERMEELTPYQDLGIYHSSLGDAYLSKASATSAHKMSEEWLHLAIQQYKQAIQLFEQEDEESQSEAYASFGTALNELKQYKEAESAYRAALELQTESPDRYQIFLRLGLVLYKLENFTEAQHVYERAIRICEEHIKRAECDGDQEKLTNYMSGLAWACNDLAYYLYAEREIELEKGLSLVNRALKIVAKVDIDADEKKTDEGNYLDTRGWIQYHLGQYEAACCDLERAIELTKGSRDDHAHLALAYEKRAEFSQAESQREQWKEKAKTQWKLAHELDHDGVWEQ